MDYLVEKVLVGFGAFLDAVDSLGPEVEREQVLLPGWHPFETLLHLRDICQALELCEAKKNEGEKDAVHLLGRSWLTW